MSQSPIPPECLRIVVDHLSLDNDTLSLTTLLRVNRFFANVALPFLYRDPFTLVARLKTSSRRLVYINHLPSDIPNQLDRNTILLTRTLLRQAPLEDITDLLRGVCFFQRLFDGDFDPWTTAPSEESPYKPVLHYLPYVTHLPTAMFPDAGPSSNPRLVAYLMSTGFFDGCRTFNLWFPPDLDSQHVKFDTPMVIQEFRRQLFWALCIPESTRTLQILVTDAHRFLDKVGQFKMLDTLQVSLDHHMKLNVHRNEHLPPKEMALEDARRVELNRHLEAMVEFVQEHTRIHKGILRSAELQDNRTARESHLPATHGYQQRMIKCLPLVLNPIVLRPQDFKKFLYTSEDINLNSLKIFSNLMLGAQTNALLARVPPFFHRCRALKSISTVLFGDDPFEWAVQERRVHDAQFLKNQDDSLTPPSSLVPVEEVLLRFGGQIRGQPIDSVAHGFGATLEFYDIAGWRKFDSYQHAPAVFGQGWNLPRLRILTATTSKGRLTIHPDALAGCPAVKKVTLQDSVVVYPAVGIPSWTSAHLPQLNTLHLSGTTVRLFHPDTLHSTVSLEMMTLAKTDDNLHWREHDFDSIEAGKYGGDGDEDEENDDDDLNPFALHPSINHLLPVLSEQRTQTETGTETTTTPLTRPMWTWDWHLPHLEYLYLCSEFAFSFQFRMLRQTPSLAELCLVNTLSEGDHKRTVTVDELRDHDRPVPKGESMTGFISLPNMTHIMLITGWTIGPQFWQTLFRKVMPSIAVIREAKTSGFTLQDWVDATLGLEKLRFAGTMMTVKYEEPLALGLRALDEYVGAEGRPRFYFVDAADKKDRKEEFEEPLSGIDEDLDYLQVARYTS